jgi:hypothetical protein
MELCGAGALARVSAVPTGLRRSLALPRAYALGYLYSAPSRLSILKTFQTQPQDPDSQFQFLDKLIQ